MEQVQRAANLQAGLATPQPGDEADPDATEPRQLGLRQAKGTTFAADCATDEI